MSDDGEDLWEWWERMQREARQRAEDATNAGIEEGIEHAEHVEPGWGERAFALLVEFAKRNERFLCEDVRSIAERNGFLSLPPDKRAWGAVIRRAVVAGVIEAEDYEACKAPKVHRTVCTRWRSLLR